MSLAVVAVLISVSIPVYMNMTAGANDVAAQSLVRNAMNAERLYHLENLEFTANRRDLEAVEPSLVWNEPSNPPGTVRVRMNNSRSDYEVCVYSQSETGTWYAVYENVETGTLYGRPDQLRGCSANTAARHWEEGW